VIATDKDEVEAEVAKITGGKGAYGGIDAVGGTLSSTLLNSIREGGTLLVYGGSSQNREGSRSRFPIQSTASWCAMVKARHL
jgi:NADPH:quinone reductase-like Zn-dependent oxidoreductase